MAEEVEDVTDGHTEFLEGLAVAIDQLLADELDVVGASMDEFEGAGHIISLLNPFCYFLVDGILLESILV